MFQSALRGISSTQSLKAAWTYIYNKSSSRSKNTKDINKESINSFSAKRDSNLKALSERARYRKLFKEIMGMDIEDFDKASVYATKAQLMREAIESYQKTTGNNI